MCIHLHLHSQYSILDALPSVKEIAKRASHMQMPAVALTDHGNLYGAVEFYMACQYEKVKPIIGCEFYVAPRSRLEKSKMPHESAAYHLTVLAMNLEGYHNLCKLSSLAFLEGMYYHPRIDEELLATHAGGLLAFSGCARSLVSSHAARGDKEQAMQTIERYQNFFNGNYYIELQRHRMKEEDRHADYPQVETWLEQLYRDEMDKQDRINACLIEIAKEKSIPLVATNDVHYLDRNDWKAHEILLNIQSGEPCEIWENDSLGNPKFRKANPKRRVYASHELYFKSKEQMQELFSDLPQAIENTYKIAEQCNVELDFKTKHYPIYLPPSLQKNFTEQERKKAVEAFLWDLCEKGIAQRYTQERLEKVKEFFPDKDPLEVVKERLAYEMSVIIPKEMSDYLLIVWDFIHWAKYQGIPMGPGRGSGVGSIVLYLIGVTDIEPIRFSLFFERFINPERISYPDIDVDICMDRRGEVINYTLNKYGKGNIAQIITFGTMKAKMALKDVGRVLSVPLAKVNEVAKLVPEDLNITLEKALEKDLDLRALYESDEEVKRIIDIGQILEGTIRSTGIHAAGIIISGEPLMEYIPICLAKDSDLLATQYSMKPVEAAGMLKVDFLGLKTLTSIQKCVDGIRESKGINIDWINLPLDDEKTFELLNQGKTSGVFQLESAGMQDLARHLHLDRFEEIIAVGALYRPGPMDMIPSFINRKHGREPIEYDHPWMEKILSETYGIMVYQEQVMQIAQELANYSLGEGDVLRRAMGKKDAQQMGKEREKFAAGCLQNGIDGESSGRIFDKMEKFAAYGFNKSHAAAYAYLSYVTAYLKANYPKDWMAALMTCDQNDLSKVGKIIREAQSIGIAILPPDVNEAAAFFIATDKGIRFALSAIRGIGSGVVEALIEERKKKGPYRSLYDCIQRIDTKKVGKKALESLCESGAFDFTLWSREALRVSVEPMFEVAQRQKKDKEGGYLSLFDKIESDGSDRFKEAPKVIAKSRQEVLLKEKELLGFFLTGHPMDSYKNILARLSCVALYKAIDLPSDAVFRSAFIVEGVNVRFSAKSQKKFAILQISDGMVSYELPIWPEMYEEHSHLLLENQLLYAVLAIQNKEDDLKLSCFWLSDLSRANEQTIVECDLAYDKAKQSQARSQAWKKGEKKKVETQKTEKIETVKKSILVKMQINGELISLSDILELRDIFEKSRGDTPIDLNFLTQGGLNATVKIAKDWGVDAERLMVHLPKKEWLISVLT